MADMEQIGWLIEREPAYNALVNEMYPREKIEKEHAMIIEAAAEQRRINSVYGNILEMTGLRSFPGRKVN